MNDRAVGDAIAGDWSFGAGFNIVDDGGKTLGGLFNGSYNHFHMPFTVNAEYFYNSQFSFNATISFNKYMGGKIVDSGTIQEDHEANYVAFDLGSKLYFRDIFKDYVFEPYVFLGLGYTSIGSYKTTPLFNELQEGITVDANGLWDVPTIGRLTINGGIGINYWISTVWGVNINFTGKWGMNTEKYKKLITNQTQFSFGGFYCLKKL
jgi:hypothetical protein